MIEEKQGHSVKIHPLELQSLSSVSITSRDREFEETSCFLLSSQIELRSWNPSREGGARVVRRSY